MGYDKDKQRVHLLVSEVGFRGIEALKEPYLEAVERGVAKARLKHGPSWRTKSRGRAIVAIETYKGGVRSRFFNGQRRIYSEMSKLHRKISEGSWPKIGSLAEVEASDIGRELGIKIEEPPAPEAKPAPDNRPIGRDPSRAEAATIKVAAWEKTASGRWRKAAEMTAPEWVTRVNARMPQPDKPGHIQVFGAPEQVPILLKIEGAGDEAKSMTVNFQPVGKLRWGNAHRLEPVSEAEFDRLWPGIRS